jgi:flagellar hook-associated protein 3 FlgL
MRVTQNMLTGFAARSLQQNQNKLLKVQSELSTGNKINRASDDPAGMRKILDYRTSLSRIAQYQNNISAGSLRIKTAETTLDTVDKLLTQAKETAMDNATSEASARELAADGIRSVFDQVMSLANTQDGDTYLFSGHESDAVPFTRDDTYTATYHGDDNAFRIKTGDTSQLEIDTSGTSVFTGTPTDGVNVFDAMRDVAVALEADPLDTDILDEAIGRLDEGIQQIQNSRQGLSLRYSQLESTQAHLKSVDQLVTGYLADTQKADKTEAAVQLSAQELAYEAAISTVSTMFDNSLIKFLS